MNEVFSLRGPVAAESLGATLMHEHIAVLDHELMRTFPTFYPLDRESVVAAAVSRLDKLVDDGITTVVDMTVLGLGRDLELMRRIGESTTLQILVATGAYVLRDLPVTLQLRGPGRTAFGGVEPLTEMFVSDIQIGIEGTDVRATVLKCATDRFGMTKDCERVIRAVAQAHRQTGALISTHSNASHEGGLEQIRVLAEEGVPLNRVIVGHCGDTSDIGYLRQILDTGASIGLDRFGLDYYLPLASRIEVVEQLVELGYERQLVLSHDSSCHHIGYSHEEMRALAPAHSMSLLPVEVIPLLRRRGMAESVIDAMLVANPRRLLADAG